MGTTFIRGNSRVIEYRLNGKIKRESIGNKNLVTKTMAKEIIKKREQQIKLGQYDMLESKIPTLEEFSKSYMNHVSNVIKKRSWKRDELCIKHLLKFFKGKKLSEIKPQDIDDYKKIRLNEVSQATINRELEVLRSMFNLADRWNKFFGKNPVSISGLFKLNNNKERILKSYEEEKLLDSCNSYLRNIIICALNTGMRKGEIISLKWDNIDLNNNVITLEHINTKSNKTRRIPINSTMRKMFLELRLQRDGNDYVFFNSDRRPYTRQDSLNRVFYKALEKANIKGLRFHDLRHTCATRMIEHGANIVAVSRILGHASLDMTMRYAHPEESLKDAVEKLASIKV